MPAEQTGIVYLVGAGPGDPDLITWKGRKLLEQADSVLYDNLAAPELLLLPPPHAERLYVGKKKSLHSFSQEEISALLIERARRGWRVVRLKGGDPYIFGRGGEEVESLADEGIPFEVVPGVTTPLGIAAYTGVPLTHREHTSVVTFVTGHHVPQIDWSRVGTSETLVVFMGLQHLEEICREIVRHGRSPETPAMVVQWATRPNQQTVVGTLSSLPGLAAARHLRPPATVVIGEVVNLRARLDWYERLPLFGQRVAVTRAATQAGSFSDQLRTLGASVIECPTIAIQPPDDPAPLDRALAQLAGYDWVIFTSVNGVARFLERLDASPCDLRQLRARLCAIGPATRRAIEALHLKVDLMPEEYVAESVVAAFTGIPLSGQRILLPRAAIARDLIPLELRQRGATVDVAEAYRTVIPADAPERVAALLADPPHWITFTSSSTVNHFLQASGGRLPEAARVASIGPVTSATLRAAGCPVHAEAQPHTMEGLLRALRQAGEVQGS